MNEHDSSAIDDVRMRGFTHRRTVEAALAWLDAQLQRLGAESVPLQMAAGRVLATPVVSEVNVPAFDRATMDGYAVVADSTEGASSYNRLPLTVVGTSLPGHPFHGSVAAGQAVRIMTGAPMPPGCDAVLPAEWVERVSATAATRTEAKRGDERETTSTQCISALDAVSPGKHVGRVGEDIVRGTTLFQPGRLLRPQDLGVLSSVGVSDVPVFRRPQVRLVVTGNELLPSGSQPHGYRVVDANGPMLAALVARDGGLVDFPGVVPDEHDAILNALHADADVIIVSGGSSVGIDDIAPMLLARHGELAIHGVAMRPSSPTGLGRIEHRLVFLLPGNPVSCLCAYDFFAGRAIRVLGGRPESWPYQAMRARLTRKISSPIGRLDYARVQVVHGAVEPLSVGGASVLSSTTRADGFIIVPADSEGFAPGAEVDVWLYA
jgi:molybdopterin molybdotransferase